MKFYHLFITIGFGVFVGLTSIYLLDPPSNKLSNIPQKYSRLPASTSDVSTNSDVSKKKQSIPFLSKGELFLLKNVEKKSYLNRIAKSLANAKKISKVVYYNSSFFVKEAWAEVTCPIYGLHPAVQENEEACSRPARGILISSESAERFHEDHVGTTASGQKYLICPSGQQMCNPALLGFERHGAESKQRLRCLPEATNDNCLALETDGDQIGESLDLLNEANPEFWDEFAEGINELCTEDGSFNAEDEGCNSIRTQMKHAEREYRNKLNRRYRNLSRAIETQNLRGRFTDRRACQERSIDEDNNLSDFGNSGVKIIVSGDACFRVPSYTQVRRNEDGSYFYFRTLDGTGDAGEREEERIVFLSEASSQTDRLINFNCGPCNAYASINNCINEMSESEPDLSGLTRMGDGLITISPLSRCEEFLSSLRSLEVSEEALQNVADPQNRRSFWESDAVR